MNVSGRSVIVTGAGGDGSGRAIARRFAKEGASVVVNDINEAGARATVKMIESAGGRAVTSVTDIRSENAVKAMFAFAEKMFGPLAVLVNNAGPEYHPGEPLEHWKEMIETDLLGAAYTIRHAIDAMRRHKQGGAIVNMTSISALAFGGDDAADAPAYDASKAGIMRLSTGLAKLAHSDNIRVNCLAPGWIASHGPREYWESLSPEQRLAQDVPSRLLSVDEVANAIFRLATDETLFGRVMVWHSEDKPKLIPFADRGYQSLEA